MRIGITPRFCYGSALVAALCVIACTGEEQAAADAQNNGAAAGSSATGNAGTVSANGGSAGTGDSGAPSSSGATSEAGSGSVLGGAGGDAALGNAGASGVAGAAGGPPVFQECAQAASLGLERLATTSVAEMGSAFDPDQDDDTGPYDWSSNYGKTPEIIALGSGSELHVLWQDQNAASPQAFAARITPSADSYTVTVGYRLGSLGRIMGFAVDEAGNYFYATGVDEDDAITVEYPAADEHRSNIVRLVKFDPSGCMLWETDVDPGRVALDAESEPIINPMVAASSRLAYGNGSLSLVHGINTNPDDNGTRHQKAITTHFDAATGGVTRTDTMWVSHSFDQRLAWDGQGFVELHLGDAYPRAIALGRFTADDGTDSYELFRPKGETGDNSTFTRLGGMALVDPAESPDFGTLVVFTTDRTPDLPVSMDRPTLAGTQDLALLRVRRDFATVDPEQGGYIDETGDTQAVMSSGSAFTNHMTWLTNYGEGGRTDLHACRSRIVTLGGNQFLLLWEQWEQPDNDQAFLGTWGQVIDASGTVLQPAMQLSDRHLLRGDDVSVLAGKAVVVRGAPGSITLELIGSDLQVQQVSLL